MTGQRASSITASATLPRKNLGTPFLACVLITITSMPSSLAKLTIPAHARSRECRYLLHQTHSFQLPTWYGVQHGAQLLVRSLPQPTHKSPFHRVIRFVCLDDTEDKQSGAELSRQFQPHSKETVSSVKKLVGRRIFLTASLLAVCLTAIIGTCAFRSTVAVVLPSSILPQGVRPLLPMAIKSMPWL